MEGHISAELWALGGLVVLFVVAALGSLLAMHIDRLPAEPSTIPPSGPPDLNVPSP